MNVDGEEQFRLRNEARQAIERVDKSFDIFERPRKNFSTISTSPSTSNR